MPALIGLIVAIFLIWLYVLLMGWMWRYLVPEILVIGSLLGTLAGPIVYGLTTFELFHRDNPRKFLWGPYWLLLGLIYFDMAALLLGWLSRIELGAASLAPLFEGVNVVAVELFPNKLILGLLSHRLVEYNWWLGPLLSLLIKGFLLVACLLGIRGLENGYNDGKQPAPRQYFFGQAFVDLRDLIVASFKTLGKYLRKGFLLLPDVAEWEPGAIWLTVAFTWPMLIGAGIAFAISLGFAALTLVLVLLAHSIAVTGIVGLSLAVSALLWLIERSIIWVRSRWAKCPHAGCHQKVPLPIYQCSKCGTRHDRLIPGRYGVFRRTCECGQSLPTFSWFGKQKLRALCQRCKKPMLEALFGANVHIPVYGGTSSGKTMFMMANTWQLVEGHLAGTDARLIDERDVRSYEGQWKPDFQSGRVRGATTQMLPDAFLLSARRKDGLPISLYLYDPAGEAMVREKELAGQKFLQYFDGLALLVDPLSIPELARKYQEAGHSLPATTSPNPPSDVVSGIKNALMRQAGLKLTQRFKRRVALVITKGDIPFIQKELGVKLPTGPPGDDWKALGEETSEKLRSWLERHDARLLQQLQQFGDLRFFLVSSLGHEADSVKTFKPRRTLHPLCWLLSTRKTLTLPTATRIATRAAEVAIVTVLLAAFLLIPFLLLRPLAPITAGALDRLADRQEAGREERLRAWERVPWINSPGPQTEAQPAQIPPVTTTPPPPLRKARIVIRSNVEGDLALLDNTRLGPTPQTLELGGGSYLVEVMKEGCRSSAEMITVREGVDRTIWFKLDCERQPPVQIAQTPPPAPKEPVRAPPRPAPTARFERPSPSVVRDRETGLHWTASDNGKDIKWSGAEEFCDRLYQGGTRSWRLPSKDELKSLWDPGSRSRFAIRGGIRLTGCCPWTAEQAPNSAAWALDFARASNNGRLHWQVQSKRKKDGCRALCVTRMGLAEASAPRRSVG